MSNKKNSYSPLVYSTDPNFQKNTGPEEEEISLMPENQKLRILLDKKHRAGKAVTLITGFVGSLDELELLCKKLKNFCGCGGTVKNGEVIVQGDNRDKILTWLNNNGFKLAKKI